MSTTRLFDSPQEKEYWDIHQYRFEFLEQHIQSLQLPQGASVLDVGCYPPILFSFLKQQGYTTYGIASTHEQMESETVKVLNIEKEKFPWKNSSFNLVVFTEVIEHLPHNPVIPLKEMYRVLAPGGVLMITTPNAVKLHHRLNLLSGKSTSFPVEQLMTVQPDDGSLYHLHNREYTLDELVELLRLVGFEIAAQEHVCLYPPTREKVKQESPISQGIKWAGYLAQQTVDSFKDSLYILARKPEFSK
jgi:2-polyprenyl-3-methyl-5-hydroxy-6-metoxy-1,4-benzoquinol methylase